MENNTQQIQSTKEHCFYCFDVIIAALQGQNTPEYPRHLPKFSTPLFVTWNTKGDNLRGCIGTFGSAPIETTLGKYAQISAFQDTRFKPIKLQELKDLSVSVSLLVNFQEGLKAYDWQVGKHGIVIDFKTKGKHYNATFLPEVASDYNWTQDITLEHLINKAGYSGHYKDVVDNINLTTYESSKIKVTYQEYAEFRKL